MAIYKAPETSEGRLKDFFELVDEFKTEFATFVEKGKKASAFRARKALLSISKLTKLIRKDVSDSIEKNQFIFGQKSTENTEKKSESIEQVIQTSEPPILSDSQSEQVTQTSEPPILSDSQSAI
jgi:hypothetical protein